MSSPSQKLLFPLDLIHDNNIEIMNDYSLHIPLYSSVLNTNDQEISDDEIALYPNCCIVEFQFGPFNQNI